MNNCNINKNIDEYLEDTNKKYIYILLLRYPGRFSKILQFVAGAYYNHASIGINGLEGIFYSYVKSGFRKELPKNHPTFKNTEVPCSLYRIEISNEIYNITKNIFNNHEKQSHKIKYNILGLILCLMRFPNMIKNKYFCSQFVSETLGEINIVNLEKHSSLYLPDDFTKIKELDLCFSGLLSQLINKPNININLNNSLNVSYI